MILEAIAALAAAIWLYLVFARGGFWLCSERDERADAAGSCPSWPPVTVVIPARNEADGIAETVGSLLRQDYAGHVHDHPGRRRQQRRHRRRRAPDAPRR